MKLRELSHRTRRTNKHKSIMKELTELRNKIALQIKAMILSTHNDEIRICDIDEGSSPILQEDEFDVNNTYTLDEVYLRDGIVYLDGSNSYTNFTWRQDNIGIEILAGVLDFLQEHEEEIDELKGEEGRI